VQPFPQREEGNSQAEGLQLDDSLDTAHIRAPRVRSFWSSAGRTENPPIPGIGGSVLINRYVLLTNNPTFAPKKGVDLEMVRGGAVDVFHRAKRCILRGCRLLNHPLYGNFTPQQQPFRSLLLSRPGLGHEARTDSSSYELIQTALERYGSRIHNLPKPEDYPQNMRADYAYLDRTLMQDVLQSYCGRV